MAGFPPDLCRLCAALRARTPDDLCTRCTGTAVTSQDGVKAELPKVRVGLRAMGLRLSTPVRVRLVTAAEMAAMAGTHAGRVLGMTYSVDTEVVDLAVVAGLSGPEFGAVIAHEYMHAWMAQRSFGLVRLPIAEGLSQLASDGWLERQPDPRARRLRTAIADDPDPVYGDGFRQVRAAVRRHGLMPVLRVVRSRGTLP